MGITLFSEIKVKVITSSNPSFARDSRILICVFLLRENNSFFLLTLLVIFSYGMFS